jgi:Undecaprenyl-phosphate galactose phosphotransferase WbaP
MTRSYALPIRTAFLLGLVLSLLPAFGPFSALLLLIWRRWRLARRDALWAAPALLFAVPAAVHGGVLSAVGAVATVAAPWLVFRTFAELKTLDVTVDRKRPIAWGLLAGFTLAVVLALLRSVEALDFTTSRTVAEAIVWQGSPALFGHSVLVVGGLIALLTQEHARVSWAAMGLAGFGILISGSVEAAIGWLVLAALRIALRPAGARRPGVLEAAALVAMLALASGLGPALGWGRLGLVLPAAATGDEPRNLLAGTEIPAGDWWDDRWVDVDASSVTLDGRTMTAYDVRKRGEPGWLRLQQLVRLEPGATYTLSGWIEAGGDVVPGFQGWGEAGDGSSRLVLVATLSDDGWSAELDGTGRLLDARALAREGDWHRVAASFAYDEGAPPITWFVGFTPDARRVEGGRSRVAGLMLEEGAEAGPYRPGPATAGLSFGYARAPLWRAAWEGIRARPLLGWGGGAFTDRYQRRAPDIERQELVPAHPHNLLLWVLFEKGIVGAFGLVLLLAALFGLAIRYRDLPLLSVVVAILIANLFDATLLSGAVLYPLAAVAGWRSSRRGPRRMDGAERVRQGTVWLALAASDLLAAFVALLAAQALAGSLGAPFALSAPLLLALVAWPALAWREGLYPGYGLTAAQELKKQASVWAWAMLVYGLATRLLPAGEGLPPLGLAILAAATAVGGPVARAGSKRLLDAMKVWGRPVVILGAGRTGRRVARALARRSLDGLHPVAFFDDDPALRSRRVEGVRVRGGLAEARRFAQRHHVRHAIVATTRLPLERRDRLVTGIDRVFQRVQFVPKLADLPSDGIYAADLDGMLALEVRAGLASPVNRTVKRSFDVTAVLVGGLLISPLLLLLAAAVYVDSPGPVFYGQRRIGRGGRHFKAWKFRSMVPDADAILQRQLAADPRLREEWERNHKLRDDPRVTRVGRLLRATSLDELPQLWNVLSGEMSLVGPRPIVDDEAPKYGPVLDLYRMVRPGITGYWQVSGRSDTSYENRVAMDAHYVRNWSVWFDVVILLRTVTVVLKGDGAY